MFDQFLPNYKHDFLKDERWLVKRSAHYIFRYFRDSVAEKDIEVIVKKQETAYEKIIAFLNVKNPDKPIEYYFYPDEKIKISLMGDDWYAQSIYNEFRIHVLYTDAIKPLGEHEDTHLLSLPWGLSIGFFQEGLAEYMVGHAWDGEKHSKYVKEGYAQKLFLPISEYFDHKIWSNIEDVKMIFYYSLGGLFARFLIDQYGKSAFEKFYRQTDRSYSKAKNQEIFKKIYGLSIEDMETIFKENM